MGTALSTVYDLFLMMVTDYRLLALYETDVDDFEAYLEAWLIMAIDDFVVCTQDLSYSADNFTQTLTQQNINMLAYLMLKCWAQKNYRDITQMNLHLQDRDFRMNSESNNINAKLGDLNALKEEISQRLIDYGYQHLDWDAWYNQLSGV